MEVGTQIFRVLQGCNSVEECRDELQEVLEEWLILKIRDNDPIPIVNGLDLKITEKSVA